MTWATLAHHSHVDAQLGSGSKDLGHPDGPVAGHGPRPRRPKWAETGPRPKVKIWPGIYPELTAILNSEILGQWSGNAQ